MDSQEELLVAGRTPATLGRGGAPNRRPLGPVHRGGRGEPLRTDRGRWDAYYPAFAAAVRGTGPLPVDPRDAVATAEVLDAARTSAERRELVTLL